MKLIDQSYDTIIKAKYDLFSTTLYDLQTLVKSWYTDVNIESYDKRWEFDREKPSMMEIKKSGLISNIFFAYVEDGKYYLLDGYNRLLSTYAHTENTPVYIKIITDKLADNQLMSLMNYLNLWKLHESGFSNGFRIDTYFDRGFSLLLHSKFNIDFYNRNIEEKYENRKRDNNDLDVINYYFIAENEDTGYFKTSYHGVAILLSQINIINDIKALISANNYLTPPFRNYNMLVEGFAMYLAYCRYNGNTTQYTLDYFIEKLYENKPFFKKLLGMSGTDSTRKNIYHFYRNTKEHEKTS